MTSPLGRLTKPQAELSAVVGVVSGRITVERTDRGVRDLLVEAFHVTGNGTPERLGSVCTTSQGTFQMEIPPPNGWRLPGLDRRDSWNLQLVVLAPERDGLGRNQRMLFSSALRQRAGRHEHFRIELSAEALAAAGIDVQGAGTGAADAVADAITATHAHTERLREASDQVFGSKLAAVAARRTPLRSEVRARVRAELSAVSARERASDRFVAADPEIEVKSLAAVRTDIAALTAKQPDPVTGGPVSTVRVRGRLLLTDDDKRALGVGNQPATLSEEDIEQRLQVALDKPPAIYRRHLEPDFCRPRTDAEQCLDATSGGRGAMPSEVPADSNGNRAGGNVTFDQESAVARLLARQVAPEDPVEFGAARADLEAPLTSGGVSEAISQVVFAPGPADVPAFYDFHDLQIAFEPVWQEALDDRFLADVEAAYDLIVERGGAPAVSLIGGVLTAGPATGFLSGLFDAMLDIGTAVDSEVPAAVASAVSISLEEWRVLPTQSRNYLSALATRIASLREELLKAIDPENIPDIDLLNIGEMVRAANTKEAIAFRAQIQLLTADAERIVAHGHRLLLEREAKQPFTPTQAIIEQLRRRRGQTYPFRYFAASPTHRSVNFGILVTYRQQWTPVSYQVGELVGTIPLAPKEVRKFTKKTIVKTARSQKEIESNLISRKRESEERSRAEAEIVARATAKTNFSLSNSGTVNIGGEGSLGGSATTTSTFSGDAEKHSQSVKKEFREAILKTAEEYKNERKIEVTTEESVETELTEAGEIQNPNDEIPVTFLFYELQRRFTVSEKIHRLQSVVLVAQEMPRPAEIDAAWLIRHDWILNRVLLDDSFRPALTYASTTLVSEDVVLREMRQALFRQRQLVEELKEDVADRRALAGLRYAALQRQIERTARSAESGGGGLLGGLGDVVGGIPIAGDLVKGGLDLLTGGGDGPSEAAQLREGAARDAFDRESREEQELAARLQNALSTVEAMQREYTERLAQHLRQLAQCERLATHVVQNILHYMQAIWAYEPDDQRFLRLRNVPVPVFQKRKGRRQYVIDPSPMTAYADVLTIRARPHGVLVDLDVAPLPPNPQAFTTTPLSEVADLNRPLGFKGNYMIFPMRVSNPITEFMMDPYVTLAEGEYGISDPDPLGNMTLEEFSEYVCCLRRHFDEQRDASGVDDVGPPRRDPFDELRPRLRDILKRLLELSLRNDDQVIVPSGCLYIEALPGAHSVMERFKHLHRQIDVKTAQEEARRHALDNVRRAVRILDDQLEDPDIEAKYVFEGDGTATVVPPGGPGGTP
jgi:hypothetical protein